MSIATLTVLPFALAGGGLVSFVPRLYAAGVALAILSSALPFSLEMHALAALPGRTFSILMSLEPAVAALCGLVFLGERLTTSQWLAVGLVIAASVGATVTARKIPVQVEV
jgi:inner membrane transporter RhtA